MVKCTEDLLADYIPIRSPGELYEVIDDLRDYNQKGMLREIGGTCSINDIKKGQPWPVDIITIEFETIPNGVKYRLDCEVYHGYGGVFKRVT